MSDSEKNFDMNSEHFSNQDFSNQYKNELNNIHAPEDLIMKTLARVREEEGKVQAEKAETAVQPAPTVMAANTEQDNIKTEQSYMDPTYSAAQEESYKPAKVSFFSKYKKPIATFVTIAAAAAVLIFAMKAGIFGGRQMSDSSTSGETAHNSESAESAASSAASSDSESVAEATTAASYESAAEETAEADDSDMAAESAASDSYEDAEESEGTNTYAADREKKNNMDISLIGGWRTADSINVTSELKTVFESAAGEQADLTPVAYLGSQMVSGVNHVFLCKTGEDADAYWTLAYIYEDLDGNTELTKVDALDIADSSDSNQVKIGSSASGGLMGGWSMAETNDIDSDLEKVINMAVEGEDGVSFEPVMVLNTQVVAGTNYAVLCKNTADASNVSYWTVLYVYRDLDNEGEKLNNALLVFGE